MIAQLGQQDARRLLSEGRLGHLGCIDGQDPYVVPVYYLFDGECVYCHSLPGNKISALRTNARACLQVEEIKDTFHWSSVIAFGVYEEIVDAAEREKMLAQLFARLPEYTPVESKLTESEKPLESIVFRLRVERLTGVSESWR